MFRNIIRGAVVGLIAASVVPYAHAQGGLPDIRIPADGKELVVWVRSGVNTMLTTAGVDSARFRFLDDAADWVLAHAGDFVPGDAGSIWDRVEKLAYQGIEIARGPGVWGLFTEGIRLTRGLIDAGVGVLNSITR